MLSVHRIQFRRLATFAGIGTIALVLVGVATREAAGNPENRSFLTFSKAVALPGAVLPAGSYIFEVANSDTSGNVVRVSSRTRRQVYFLGFTERVRRPAGLRRDQHVSLGEAAPGAPAPIQVWYPPSDSMGHLFIYR